MRPGRTLSLVSAHLDHCSFEDGPTAYSFHGTHVALPRVMLAQGKRVVKSFIGQTLIQTGLWHRLLVKWARGHEAIVLTYHRVIEKWDRTLDYSQPGMVVTAETFNHQLAFLKRYFEIVPLSSLISNFEFRISNFPDLANTQFLPASADPASPKAESQNPHLSSLTNPKSEIPNSKFARPLCVLTFDDGWRDNYEIAFPILRKHGVPATIFLTTDFIGPNRSFWHTELMYLLLHGELVQLRRSRRDFDAYPASLRPHLIRLARLTQAPSAHDVDPLIEAVKDTCDEKFINELMRDLAGVLRRRRPFLTDRRFFLDWDQVRKMAAAGIEIGSHGCSHRILTRLKAEEAEEELVRSKAEIKARIGQEVYHFAFPDGAGNRSLIESAGRAGYKSACLLASAPGGGPFGTLAVRRHGMHEAVSAGANGSISEASLLWWLLRAPRMGPT